MRAVRHLSLALLLVVPGFARAESTNGPAEAPPPAPAAVAAPAPAKPKVTLPPYRLVRILPDTNQALLLDKTRGKHVLVDVGDSIGVYQVMEIDADQVVLGKPDDAREFVLVAGEATPTARLSDPYPMADPTAAATPTPAAAPGSPLLDPYPAGILDPYGTDGVRTVEAPADQRVDPAKAKKPPTPPAPPAPVPPPSSAKTDDKMPTPPPPIVAPAPAPAAADPTTFSIPRHQLDAALSDFAKIGHDVQMNATDGGVLLVKVAPDAFFHKMGLRDGDLVRKVDGAAIRGLDDAAAVYARLGKAKHVTVEITRAGAPVTLKYTITK